MAVLKPLKVTIENYPAGRIRRVRRAKPSGGPRLREETIRSRASCTSSKTTSKRHHMVSAPRAGPRGEAPLCLPRRFPWCSEGRRGPCGRATLRLRPDDGVARARRTKGRGDNPLGERGRCVAREGQALRPALLSSESGPDEDLAADLDPIPCIRYAVASSSARSPLIPTARRCSSSGKATSAHDDDSPPRTAGLQSNRLVAREPGKPPTAHLDLLMGARKRSRSSWHSAVVKLTADLMAVHSWSVSS